MNITRLIEQPNGFHNSRTREVHEKMYRTPLNSLLLVSILLPCLNRAKESAYELAAIETGVDEEGKVRQEITDISHRKRHDDIYMIKIARPYRCRVVLKKPHLSCILGNLYFKPHTVILRSLHHSEQPARPRPALSL